MSLKNLLFGILILAHGSTFAQSECASFHRKNCEAELEDGIAMRYDSQSKSAIMAKGQTSEFHMVAYNGLDYRITVCADELIGTEVQFKIYEKKREMVTAEAEGTEDSYSEESSSDSYSDDSYSDNSYSDDSYSDDAYSDDSYSDDSYSTSSSSSSMDEEKKMVVVKELLYDNAENGYSNFIEFTADGSKSLVIEITIPGEQSMSKLKIKETGCVGVLIEHAKSRRAGF